MDDLAFGAGELAGMRGVVYGSLPDICTLLRANAGVYATLVQTRGFLRQIRPKDALNADVPLDVINRWELRLPYDTHWVPRSRDRAVIATGTYDIITVDVPKSLELCRLATVILIEDSSDPDNPIIAGLPANATVRINRLDQNAFPGTVLYATLRVRLVFPSMPATRNMDFGALSQTRLAATPDTDLREQDRITVLAIDGHTLEPDTLLFQVDDVQRVPDPAAHILATLSGDVRST